MSITTELKSYGLTNEVITEAVNIHSQMNSVLSRGSKRSSKYLFCIYNAYLNLNKVVDIRFLARKMRVDQRKISEAFTVCSPIRTGYKFKKVRFSIIEYISYYVGEIGLEYETKVSIFKKMEVVFPKPINKSYKKSYSNQTIAIAFVISCLELLGLKSQVEKFKIIIYRKTSTIDNMIKMFKKNRSQVCQNILRYLDEHQMVYVERESIFNVMKNTFFGIMMVNDYSPKDIAMGFLSYCSQIMEIFKERVGVRDWVVNNNGGVLFINKDIGDDENTIKIAKIFNSMLSV